MARGSKAPSERRRHGKMYVPFYSTVLHVEVFRMYNKVHLEACRYLPDMYDASLRALPAVVCRCCTYAACVISQPGPVLPPTGRSAIHNGATSGAGTHAAGIHPPLPRSLLFWGGGGLPSVPFPWVFVRVTVLHLLLCDPSSSLPCPNKSPFPSLPFSSLPGPSGRSVTSSSSSSSLHDSSRHGQDWDGMAWDRHGRDDVGN